MTIYSVFDPGFKPYGQVVEGLDEAKAEILEALARTPLPQATLYVPSDPELQELPAVTEISEHCYGGMHVQLGWCNGRNTRLNCLEYHRDSEFNLGTEDFILLLAKQEQVTDGLLDTSKVVAFRVPAGVLVEIYATTFHYAPCHVNEAKGFRVMIALPWGTNGERPVMEDKTREDRLLTARNKWLYAHPESDEAKQGAYIGLTGENIDIQKYI